MNQESTKAPIGAAGSPSVAGVVPTAEQMQALADQLKTWVKADKPLVNLSPGASDQITLTNKTAGWMSPWITGPKAARECGTRPEGAGLEQNPAPSASRLIRPTG